MALLTENLDYTDRDFDALLVRLKSLIRSVFPTWTDSNVANFGEILLELYCFVGDVLGVYQDNQANESRLVTGTQRKNLIALCKLIGFSPAGATAATADVQLRLRAPPIGNVTLPIGTTVYTAEVTAAIPFQLLAAVTFTAGQDPPLQTATVENSALQTDVFTSTGLENQRVTLTNTPYLDDSAIPTASDGVYTEVVNFLDSAGTDRHFVVSVDQNDRATLIFGNGINGKVPVGTISAAYKTGGGSAANVEPGAISQLPGTFADSFGNPAQVSVTNPVKASGGTDRQTNNQIKLLAPETLRAPLRTVAREDFEINARRIAGVARALMTTSNEDPAVQENSGILYVVPTSGGPPSVALKNQVKDQFISRSGHKAPFPSTLTFTLLVQDPLYLAINVNAVVSFRAGVAPAVGAAAIRAALASFFRISNADGTPNPEIDFGANYVDADGNIIGTIGLGDVFDVVHDVPQVLRVGGRSSDFLLNGAHADVPILARQFPKLGSVTLVNALDGGLI